MIFTQPKLFPLGSPSTAPTAPLARFPQPRRARTRRYLRSGRARATPSATREQRPRAATRGPFSARGRRGRGLRCRALLERPRGRAHFPRLRSPAVIDPALQRHVVTMRDRHAERTRPIPGCRGGVSRPRTKAERKGTRWKCPYVYFLSVLRGLCPSKQRKWCDDCSQETGSWAALQLRAPAAPCSLAAAACASLRAPFASFICIKAVK